MSVSVEQSSSETPSRMRAHVEGDELREDPRWLADRLPDWEDGEKCRLGTLTDQLVLLVLGEPLPLR